VCSFSAKFGPMKELKARLRKKMKVTPGHIKIYKDKVVERR